MRMLDMSMFMGLAQYASFATRRARPFERLESLEGQRFPDEFAKLIAEWASGTFPRQLLQDLDTVEGQHRGVRTEHAFEACDAFAVAGD